MIETINPATGKPIAKYKTLTPAELQHKASQAQQAFASWRKTTSALRQRPMFAMARILRQNLDKIATLITLEMGKPITQSKAEVDKAAWACEYIAEHIDRYLAPESISLHFKKTLITYQPLGVIYGIMPWNYPLWQVIRFAVPAMLAGNTVMMKQAPNVTGLALELESLFLEAGFPENVFNTVVLDNALAQAAINLPEVAAISFTGSHTTGNLIATQAAKASKKIVMELGGSDPYLVLDDADLDLAADQIVRSRMNNAGQVCIAAKRAIICDAVYEPLKEKILTLMSAYTPADPGLADTRLGPLAREDLVVHLQHQVDQSLAQGARLLLGGQRVEKPGFYYAPTVLEQVSTTMPVITEETFGPVLPLLRAPNEQVAIGIANAHQYGLSAAVFTQDLAKGERIATEELEVGCAQVNQMVSSHPGLPFGGIKHSGIGRELGAEGAKAFTNIKTIIVT